MKFVPDHNAIIVSDAQASAAFYQKALGFETVAMRRPSKTVCSIFVTSPGEGFTLQLLEMGTYSPEKADYGHFSVSVSDIKQAYAYHKQLGCLAGEIMDLGYQLCYFIQDMDGYEIEIVQKKLEI